MDAATWTMELHFCRRTLTESSSARTRALGPSSPTALPTPPFPNLLASRTRELPPACAPSSLAVDPSVACCRPAGPPQIG
eukprot:8507783-Lingulodinium_polyedra.AAC.1